MINTIITCYNDQCFYYSTDRMFLGMCMQKSININAEGKCNSFMQKQNITTHPADTEGAAD